MADEVQQKPEEPKVENAVKDEPKVYHCRVCAPDGSCNWDESGNGPLQKDKCIFNRPGKIANWIIKEKKEEGKAEEPKAEEDVTKALEKHGVSIAIPEDLKAKLPEDLRAAIAAGAPVVVILDRPEDHSTWSIGSVKDFRKGSSFAKMGNKISPDQAEQLQKDFNDLIAVQSHLHDRIKAVERENRDGQAAVKEALSILEEMDAMKKAKAAAEESAKKEHEDFMKMFRDHKNMKEKLTKTTTALWDLRDGIKELYARFNH